MGDQWWFYSTSYSILLHPTLAMCSIHPCVVIPSIMRSIHWASFTAAYATLPCDAITVHMYSATSPPLYHDQFVSDLLIMIPPYHHHPPFSCSLCMCMHVPHLIHPSIFRVLFMHTLWPSIHTCMPSWSTINQKANEWIMIICMVHVHAYACMAMATKSRPFFHCIVRWENSIFKLISY